MSSRQNMLVNNGSHRVYEVQPVIVLIASWATACCRDWTLGIGWLSETWVRSYSAHRDSQCTKQPMLKDFTSFKKGDGMILAFFPRSHIHWHWKSSMHCSQQKRLDEVACASCNCICNWMAYHDICHPMIKPVTEVKLIICYSVDRNVQVCNHD